MNEKNSGLEKNYITNVQNEKREIIHYTKGFEEMFKVLCNRVEYSIIQTLKRVLGNPKDKTERFDKSRTCEISCNDCRGKD